MTCYENLMTKQNLHYIILHGIHSIANARVLLLDFYGIHKYCQTHCPYGQAHFSHFYYYIYTKSTRAINEMYIASPLYIRVQDEDYIMCVRSTWSIV